MSIFKTVKTLRGRQGFAQLLHSRKLEHTAVEVGVYRGDFSKPFMDEWDGGKLYLVDLWEPRTGYDDPIVTDPLCNHDLDLAYTKRRFDWFGDRVSLIQMSSREASINLPNDLEFVYIDANHAYDYVKQDIESWWPKIIKGGVLAGHDLFTTDHPGVTSAVAEFCIAHNLVCNVIPDKPCSWYIDKP